jgi:hypothetical protein
MVTSAAQRAAKAEISAAYLFNMHNISFHMVQFFSEFNELNVNLNESNINTLKSKKPHLLQRNGVLSSSNP